VGADAVIPRPMISTSPPYPVQKTPPATTVMVDTAAATPNSVAYVGISFRDAIAKAGLGTSPLKNQNGKFVLPTAETIDADASVLDPRTPPDQRLSLVFATSDNSHPLINYEYAVWCRDGRPTRNPPRHSANFCSGRQNARIMQQATMIVTLAYQFRARSDRRHICSCQ